MPRSYLGRVGELQLQLSEVLAAVGVAPHGGGRRDGSAGVRVDAPALAPLAVERHLALGNTQKRRRLITGAARNLARDCVWVSLSKTAIRRSAKKNADYVSIS